MFLGFGLGLTKPRGGSFSPASFFANGEQGGIYTFELGTVYQDSGFTTLANVGDPVGGVRDLSGNGNDLTQASADSRPIYTDASGFLGLRFDGGDDFLVSADNVDLSSSSALFMGGGFTITTGTSRQASIGHGGGSTPSLKIFAQYSSALTNRAEAKTNLISAWSSSGTPWAAQGQDYTDLFFGRADLLAPFVQSYNQATWNTANTSDPGSTAFLSNDVFLGSPNGIGNFFDGVLYPHIVIDRILTDEEFDHLVTWISARMPERE